MAEKLKDAEDRLLESMFASEPIEDDGFSRRVVRRIRTRIWVQRLALPVAMLIGGAIAIKPASQLIVAATKLLSVVPQDIVDTQVGWLPELQGFAISGLFVQSLVYGIILLGVGFIGSRMLTD